MSDESFTIRVGSYNLFEGGLGSLDDPGGHRNQDDPDFSRLREQVALLKRLDLDLLGLQEATWGPHSRSLADFVADELDMPWRFVGPSNFYGCDLAAFVKVSDHLDYENVTHLTGPPFVHGLTNVKLRIEGFSVPAHFLVGHSAPSSPGTRLLEAEMVTVHSGQPVIYVADFNAAATDDDPDTTGLPPYKTSKKLIKAPAQELAAAGFHDIGHLCRDRTPTVGHLEDKLAYRADRICATLPPALITDYGVVDTGDHLSDHRIVWAELTFAAAPHPGQLASTTLALPAPRQPAQPLTPSARCRPRPRRPLLRPEGRAL
ncbi:endonuclease/exonuclease/phosphatase family protein [Actinomadura sp. NPDC023710]|uniref:endonuclease/exonuclease/phosphatase family protein n=1 Tax=Actinomadura sp. NPDC023710 TaxID=3158219 RepID=UPI0033F620B0